MTKDLYVILRVTRNATLEEIRSAYRRRALELHPDKSGSNSEPFLELQQAYSILSDPGQRAAYDRQGEEIPVYQHGLRSSWRGSSEPFREVTRTPFRDLSLSGDFATLAPSLQSIVDRIWRNFELSTPPKAERSESLTVDVPLSTEDAFSGGSVRVLLPAHLPCPACHGDGNVGFYECWRCRGEGALSAEYPVEVPYPPGIQRDYIVQVPLRDLGIRNLYLTVRFRPSDSAFA